jgi:hypothetical protein
MRDTTFMLIMYMCAQMLRSLEFEVILKEKEKIISNRF